MSIFTGQNIEASDFYRTSLETLKSASGTFAEQTVLAGTLPASKLESGRHIRVRAIFSSLNRASSGVSGSCTVRLYFGSTVVASISIGDYNATVGAVLEGIIRYNGVNAQSASMSIIGNNSQAPAIATGSAAVDTSLAQNVSLTVQGSGGAYACGAATIELV